MFVFQLCTRKSGQKASHNSKKLIWPIASCQVKNDAKSHLVNFIPERRAGAVGRVQLSLTEHSMCGELCSYRGLDPPGDFMA